MFIIIGRRQGKERGVETRNGKKSQGHVVLKGTLGPSSVDFLRQITQALLTSTLLGVLA